ncbi:hypothetical protein NE235_07705 [Actinoallomurus spadix]|uniref:hypothetical protein n=1 Tax=Actinoallomurus spadix TaxID=79912 RepID=UPI002092F5FA|nr:hypothetical protein [Actinoallomurus spadix]MCO5985989.1 hypothetical protein [Actinoallomurus spadix]
MNDEALNYRFSVVIPVDHPSAAQGFDRLFDESNKTAVSTFVCCDRWKLLGLCVTMINVVPKWIRGQDDDRAFFRRGRERR